MKLTCLLLTRIALRFWVGWEFEFGNFDEAVGALFVAGDDVDGVEDEAFSLMKIKNTKMKNIMKKKYELEDEMRSASTLEVESRIQRIWRTQKLEKKFETERIERVEWILFVKIRLLLDTKGFVSQWNFSCFALLLHSPSSREQCKRSRRVCGVVSYECGMGFVVRCVIQVSTFLNQEISD